MLIASTDPLIVYYHDGFLRVTILKFDINSKEVNKNLKKFRKAFILRIQIWRKNFSKILKHIIMKLGGRMRPNLEIFR